MAPDFHTAAAQLLAQAQAVAATGSQPNATAANPGVSGTPPAPTAAAQAAPPANGPGQGVPSHVPYERVQELSSLNGQLRAQLEAKDAELAALRARAAQPVTTGDPAALAAAALREVSELRAQLAVDSVVGGGTPEQRAAVQAAMTRFPGMSAQEALAFARANMPQAFQGLPSAPPAIQVPGYSAPPMAQAQQDRILMADPSANPAAKAAAQDRFFTGLASDLIHKARALSG